MAQRVGRGLALPFHDRDTRKGVSGQQHAPAALYPRERPGTHFTVGWVGSRAGLDGRKISSPPGFDPDINIYVCVCVCLCNVKFDLGLLQICLCLIRKTNSSYSNKFISNHVNTFGDAKYGERCNFSLKR